jgi:hypothetical protein
VKPVVVGQSGGGISPEVVARAQEICQLNIQNELIEHAYMLCRLAMVEVVC